MAPVSHSSHNKRTDTQSDWLGGRGVIGTTDHGECESNPPSHLASPQQQSYQSDAWVVHGMVRWEPVKICFTVRGKIDRRGLGKKIN